MAGGRLPNSSEELGFTPLPDVFFTQVVPQIQDIAELKAILAVFYLLHRKLQDSSLRSEECPRFITYEELLSDRALMNEMSEEAFRHALDLAVKHGAILRSTLNLDGSSRDAYFVNTESGRELASNIRHGKLPVREAMSKEAARSSNIFALYEQNIGMLTPMIAEELREAEKLYPSQWIHDAFKEAVALNKRNWRYIARILERWATEGKDSGENRRSTKKDDPNKYIRGKYGHMVRR